MAESCDDCRFWGPNRPPTSLMVTGECLRFPPVLVSRGRDDAQSASPRTHKSFWCGEWQPIKKPDAVASPERLSAVGMFLTEPPPLPLVIEAVGTVDDGTEGVIGSAAMMRGGLIPSISAERRGVATAIMVGGRRVPITPSLLNVADMLTVHYSVGWRPARPEGEDEDGEGEAARV